jgi:hypothetical protein
MNKKTYCSVEKCNNNCDIKPSIGFFSNEKEKWIHNYIVWILKIQLHKKENSGWYAKNILMKMTLFITLKEKD